jgi:hypothetical protein
MFAGVMKLMMEKPLAHTHPSRLALPPLEEVSAVQKPTVRRANLQTIEEI